MKICLNCSRTEQEIPLIALHYQGAQEYICSQCFPTLIHNPLKLAGKMKDVDKIPPADHDH